MNRGIPIILAVLTVLLSQLTACSKKDKVINVADDDPQMLAAIAKARETLPQFWTVFDKPARGESGFSITKIELNMEAKVPGIDAAKFQEIAEASKKGCPVSRALAAVSEIVLNAKLVN